MIRPLALIAALAIAFTPATGIEEARALELENPEDTLVMELEGGTVYILLRPDLAPNHVARIKELVGEGYYDGLLFHRVMDGFMAQTGDPTGTGSGGSGVKLDAEFTDTPFERGTLGMARTSDPNSADSQFFIVFQRADWLDGQYTVIGQVIEGMEYVDAIKRGAPGSGRVTDPDRMISLKLATDPRRRPLSAPGG